MAAYITDDRIFVIERPLIAHVSDVTTYGSKLIANQQALAEPDFSVMGIEPPAPLQFPKSDVSIFFH